jgi:hypothetical protein
MIENHDAVRTSPHPTTFANIHGMLLQHPPRGEGMWDSNPGVNKPLGATHKLMFTMRSKSTPPLPLEGVANVVR